MAGFLATFEDANGFLDGTKISFANPDSAESESKQADSIVRSALFDLFPENANAWGDTEDTPAVVTTIAAMLMASLLYSKKYSEESLHENDYAARLWRMAMNLIGKIRDGTVELHDKDYAAGTKWGRESFWPNDTTVYPGTTKKVRAFDMRKVF